jgi:hypothetical protein
MKRITFTLDERGSIQRICADEAVEVYIICPSVAHDRVHQWSSTRIGEGHVNEEIEGYPVGDGDHGPAVH